MKTIKQIKYENVLGKKGAPPALPAQPACPKPRKIPI